MTSSYNGVIQPDSFAQNQAQKKEIIVNVMQQNGKFQHLSTSLVLTPARVDSSRSAHCLT